jgi:hypothetical protein
MSFWLDGLYQDDNDFFRFDGQIDAEMFLTASVGVGRNYAPALLFDLFHGGSLDVEHHPGVVAGAWSSAEFPEKCLEADLWLQLFNAAGYTHDGQHADRPTEPVTLYRGCGLGGQHGMAWTSDHDIARRFAHELIRGRTKGEVYTFMAPPAALLAYVGEQNGRGEREYVIDPDFLPSDLMPSG